MAVQDLVVRIGADISRLQAGVNRAAATIRQFSDRTERLGRSLQRNVTLPLLAIGGASAKLAMDFDSSMRKITGLVGIASEEVDQMRGSVLALAGSTARAPGELADALFFVTSAGLRGAEALEVLESSAKAAAAGLGETKTIADLVTSAMNAYGSENLSAAKATNVLVGAVREGKAEASELAGSMGQVLPIASELGVGFDQVGAAIAAMTRTGTNAATAATQLRAIMSSLLKPSADAAKALGEMGTSSQQLRKQLREEGLVSVLGFLRDQMENNEEAMSRVFPNIRALSGALDIMGANAEDNIAIFDRMKDTTGLNEQAFEAAQGPAFRLSQAFNRLKIEGIRLGDALIPVIEKIINFVSKMIDVISEMEAETRAKVIGIAVLLGASGPLLIAFAKVGKVVAGLASLVMTKFALITAAIGAIVVAGFWLAENWEAIGERIKREIDSWVVAFDGGAKSLAEKAVTFIAQFAPGMAGAFGRANNEALKMAQGLEKPQIEMISFGQVAKDLAMQLKDFALDVTGAGDALDRFFALFEGGSGAGSLEKLSDELESLFKGDRFDFGLEDRLTRLNEKFRSTVQSIQTEAQKLPEAFEKVRFDAQWQLDQLAFGIESALGSAINSFADGIGRLIATGGGFKGFLNTLLSSLADFASQMGRIIVGIGVAMLAIRPESIFTNPIGAIVAGGALVALGGALRALVSKGPGGSVSTGSVGFEPSLRSESAEVVFRIGNNELIGVLQQSSKVSGRSGRNVRLQ